MGLIYMVLISLFKIPTNSVLTDRCNTLTRKWHRRQQWLSNQRSCTQCGTNIVVVWAEQRRRWRMWGGLTTVCDKSLLVDRNVSTDSWVDPILWSGEEALVSLWVVLMMTDCRSTYFVSLQPSLLLLLTICCSSQKIDRTFYSHERP